jgi:hypothetical protein
VYVDSGSGSMIISAVVAGAAGAGVVAKMQWRKLSGKLRGGKGDSVETTTGTTTAAPVTADKTEQQ